VSQRGAGGPCPLSGAGNRSCHEAEGAGSRGGAELLQQVRATSLLCSWPRDGSELLPNPWEITSGMQSAWTDAFCVGSGNSRAAGSLRCGQPTWAQQHLPECQIPHLGAKGAKGRARLSLSLSPAVLNPQVAVKHAAPASVSLSVNGRSPEVWACRFLCALSRPKSCCLPVSAAAKQRSSWQRRAEGPSRSISPVPGQGLQRGGRRSCRRSPKGRSVSPGETPKRTGEGRNVQSGDLRGDEGKQ